MQVETSPSLEAFFQSEILHRLNTFTYGCCQDDTAARSKKTMKKKPWITQEVARFTMSTQFTNLNEQLIKRKNFHNFSQTRPCKVMLSNRALENSKTIKYLGLLIDKDLKFEEQYKSLFAKLKQCLGMFHKFQDTWILKQNLQYTIV